VRRRLSGIVLLASAGLASLAVHGCSAHKSATRTEGKLVAVTERDFRISVAGVSIRPRVSSGDLRLSVSNRGPDTHELLVARMRGSRLPLRTDGLTVDEDAAKPATVATLDGGQPGTVRQLRLRLAPGHYVLFCNMAGHYLGGMRTELVVQ
jgi:uncharacterized cupredoxin-like copper-binding protein